MSDHVDMPSSRAIPEDKTLAMVGYILLLLSFVTGGITGLVALIMAYANRSAASPELATHYTFQIRTCWIGLAALFMGGVLLFWGAILAIILIGIPLLILAKLVFSLTCVWYAVRSILGLIIVSRDEAYPRPLAVFW